jgi:predicted dehydrogenase
VTTKKAGVGIIGCGVISGIYLQNLPRFEWVEVRACADIDMDRARARAAEYGVAKACSVDELLADPEIDIVLNLTIPRVHGEIALAAVRAGKSVYNEKPLALARDEAKLLLDEAKTKGLQVGCAPDTFLGAGLQTCRKLIDDGEIGVPVAATAFMLSHGPESWHPDPDFFYQPGAGPMFDMGPYYLTALVSLLGPVQRVTGSTRVTFPQRSITSKPRAGTIINVNTPTHVVGVLDFVSGAIATLVTSFDVWGTELPPIEIYGSAGTLSVPDPNTFGGSVRLRSAGSREWNDAPLTHGFAANSRGIGLADMAKASLAGKGARQTRASGDLAYHVLDIMHAIHESSQQGSHIVLSSQIERPKPLPVGLAEWTLD